MTGITDPSEPYFKDGAWGWDGTVWRKLPLLFGYYDRWNQKIAETKDGDGTWSVYTTAVPENYIYVLQGASAYNNTRIPGGMTISLDAAGMGHMLERKTPTVLYEPIITNGSWVMKYGDKVQFSIATCLDSDVMRAFAWGYMMKLTE